MSTWQNILATLQGVQIAALFTVLTAVQGA